MKLIQSLREKIAFKRKKLLSIDFLRAATFKTIILLTVITVAVSFDDAFTPAWKPDIIYLLIVWIVLQIPFILLSGTSYRNWCYVVYCFSAALVIMSSTFFSNIPIEIHSMAMIGYFETLLFVALILLPRISFHIFSSIVMVGLMIFTFTLHTKTNMQGISSPRIFAVTLLSHLIAINIVSYLLHLFHEKLTDARLQLEKQNQYLEEEVQKRSADLIEKEKQLAHSEKNHAIGQLAGGVAHDIKNALSPVLSYAEMIKRKLEDPKLSKYMDHIAQSGVRIDKLSRQLLTYARKGKYQESDINTHEIIIELISLLSQTFNKNITIRKELNAPSSIIFGDPTLIQNMFMNLAVNARDAMPDGGTLSFTTQQTVLPKKYADKTLDKPGRLYLQVTVSDTGLGMPEEVRKKAFEPYFTTKPIGKGTGLGLASVGGCVDMHNGIIDVESEEGKGTWFDIFLPLKRKNIQEKDEDGSGTFYRGTGKLMIIDDEFTIRNMLNEQFSELGYTPIPFEDGRKALEYFSEKHSEIRLVILDMVMPHISGRECLSELKSIDPDVKVLILTGYSEETEIKEIRDIGVSAIMEKPYKISKLSKQISKILTPSE